ncbi:MAG: hypothetical protein AAGF79_01150 [Pseudomonadota bacterium]
MGSNQGASLGGEWTGVYDYPDPDSPPVPFEASLMDISGVLWGTIREPNTFSPVPAHHLDASLSGSRSGREVQFLKEYADVPGADAPVGYVGKVSADGTRIEGDWSIWHPGQMITGRFIMNRPGAAEEPRTRVAAAEAKL